jgi:quercetin dioxygenase-like cupin family protein
MTTVGEGDVIPLDRGVRLECLVGSHNEARGLSTGIVTLDPSAALPYHTHECTEAITLLSGKALVEVEGRRHELELLDNVVIPRDLAHQVRNTSEERPAVFHIALASDTPTHMLVPNNFEYRPGTGWELVNRFRTSERFEAGPNTEFIDFFNQSLLPGIEMSGGYGQFLPGGRLPAHVHDFDESICIIEGEATCIVEGRRYMMRDCTSALQPRGRVHYFINESDAPMSMLWVYAGSMPERIVVDERCATVEGNPWREGGPR